MLFKPKSARKAPFRRGRRYRVLKTFTPLYDDNGTFHTDDLLEYRYSAHSIYDGMDGYFFIQKGASRIWRRWDISIYDDLEVWPTLFELLPRRKRWWVRPILLLLAVALLAVSCRLMSPSSNSGAPRTAPAPPSGTRSS